MKRPCEEPEIRVRVVGAETEQQRNEIRRRVIEILLRQEAERDRRRSEPQGE